MNSRRKPKRRAAAIQRAMHAVNAGTYELSINTVCGTRSESASARSARIAATFVYDDVQVQVHDRTAGAFEMTVPLRSES